MCLCHSFAAPAYGHVSCDDLEEPGWESLIAFMTRQVFMIFFMLEQQPVIHESLRFLFTYPFHTHPAHPSDNMHPSDMVL